MSDSSPCSPVSSSPAPGQPNPDHPFSDRPAPGEVTRVLAVDGGGTKTALAVIDRRGQVLERVTGGGVNPFDQPRWDALLSELLTRLTEPYGAAALALPGYGEAQAVTERQDAFARRLGVPVAVLNDVDAAQVGAFAGGPGLLILAGTGSMVWGRDGAGQVVRAGGWGELLGDEGSAYWTGRQALSALTHVLDGRAPRAALHDRLLAALREEVPDAPSEGDLLLSWLVARRHARSEIAALARRLDGWADAGDPDAVACLTRAAEELARQARAARQRLPTLGEAWSVAGSFTRSWTVRHVLKRELGAEHFRQATLPPLGGAALVAARAAGWPLTPAWVERLTAELR